MDIKELRIVDIQPSQFYISEEKLEQIGRWFEPEDLSGFEAVPVKELDGHVILRTGIPGLMQPGLRGLRGFRWSGMRMSWTGRLTGFVRMPAESGESAVLRIWKSG